MLLYCYAVDCTWRYINCRPCTPTCGNGTKTCTPEIIQEAEYEGEDGPDYVHSGQPRQVLCEGLKPCRGL